VSTDEVKVIETRTRKGIDRTHISFGEEYTVRYWCNALGCTPTALRTAVRAVGNDAAAVREQLKKK
jgi:hypothetical protein